MITKQHILNEIQRTAVANGGAPLGRLRFFSETGIKESNWLGVYWPRWNDAVREAGLTPNEKTTAYSEDWLILKLIELTRELGHFPVNPELRLKSKTDKDFPNDATFRRFGSKKQMISVVANYCRKHADYDDVLLICEMNAQPVRAADESHDDDQISGFVYLLKSGRFFKIGRSNSCGRRERELAIQMPEKTALVHEIPTDDPVGIERYWHQRFESKRKNGEWFDLTSSDVKAFKRRRFM